jgi:quercetin dioxygenase-like cupin family protein
MRGSSTSLPRNAPALDIAPVYDRGVGGPVWGTETEDLNATILEWRAGESTPAHVNDSRDVAVVVLAGAGMLELDGEERPLAAGEVVVVPKGARRRIVAGGDGIRYATVHRRRGGLQIQSLGR